MASASLCTTIVNNSGYTRSFPLLPPHGRRLAPNEQVSIPGDLRTLLAPHKRNFDALETLLSSGDLAILATPAPVLYDATLDVVKVIALDDGELGVADPSYGGYSSSEG